jgi:hypothetical protein
MSAAPVVAAGFMAWVMTNEDVTQEKSYPANQQGQDLRCRRQIKKLNALKTRRRLIGRQLRL